MICWNCQKEIAGEHFCPQCNKIQAQNPAEDYFFFFGYQNRQLDLDNADLEKKFYSFSRQFHPDFYQQSSEFEKNASLEKSSLLNDAYRTLKDPVRRAEYIIQIEGAEIGKAQAPPDLLSEMFELNEQLEELRDAKREGDEAAVESLKSHMRDTLEDLEHRQRDLLSQLQSVFKQWDSSGSEQRKSLLKQMSDILSQHSYVRNLVRDLREELT
ncbi:MAG TPA: Fe-S protein assembly co-chaperone HscB [Blastocatellia bacterium]|nr:Fe-S protein assembly co-chaperone HscB [Blastocatellia bacterium]